MSLEELMERIPPWTQSTNYNGWEQLRVAGLKLQMMHSNQAVASLNRFAAQPHRSVIDGDADISYLLFRFAFDLPTNSMEQPKYYKVWRGIQSATNADGTFDQSWPIG